MRYRVMVYVHGRPVWGRYFPDRGEADAYRLQVSVETGCPCELSGPQLLPDAPEPQWWGDWVGLAVIAFVVVALALSVVAK